MIDLHCHIDLYPDPASVAAACETKQTYVLSVTTTPSAFNGTKALERGRMRTALGLHPQLARERKSELPLFEELLPSVRYVGEIGLDGSPECRPFWDDQVEVFERILKLSNSHGGRLLSVHSRRAASAVLDCLEKNAGDSVPILHWFSGTKRELDRAVSMGCWFSVGPAMLRGDRGRKLVSKMPPERVLTETDGPFAQRQDQPLMPWDVLEAVTSLSNIWECEIDQASSKIRGNLKALTGKLPGV